ncbi:hypothetical protein [Nocardiopsis sp. NRRL B-16309]|uniref:hypothetical protein n=1 Tax=Nocardiopsis sp. NRRL B-16309 TaxID=1519494 RepID=UPI0006ADEF19|nr:hypothetical protein [Nocardiopsis sp. NRRL B-16309]KOX13702.1 hypothetical protein ADL05_18670 [Nocardiopsis sp. NRRL B-16309]
MYLPFIPEEFAGFRSLADDNGWESGIGRGDWYQHLGQNRWVEYFGATKPIVDADGDITGWDVLETWWSYTHSENCLGPGHYVLAHKDFKHPRREIKPHYEQHHDHPEQEKWVGLFASPRLP